MNRKGLDFEFIPKESNPSSIGKTLFRKIIKTIPFNSDVLLLKPSEELFNNYAMLMPVLTDLEIPNAYYKDVTKTCRLNWHFEPADNSAPIFITWHDIKKVIIPREDAK